MTSLAIWLCGLGMAVFIATPFVLLWGLNKPRNPDATTKLEN